MRTTLKLMVAAVGLVLLSGAACAAFAVLAPKPALEAAQDVMRWHAGLQAHELRVADVRIAYLEGGTGKPLLLLHGFGANKDNFVAMARHLTPTYRVIIPDAPGFGESSRDVSLRYSIDDQVERLHAFAQALGLETLAVGGNSMGGWLAGAYAAKYPDEVKSLWLIDPAGVASAPKSELMQRLLAAPPGQSPMVPRTAEELESAMALVVAKPIPIPRVFLQVMVDDGVAHAEVLRKIQDESLASTPLEDRLQGVATPTFIVWGDHDRAVDPAGAAILDERMPNAEVRIMKDIGHVPMMEAPELTANEYLAFRRSTSY